MDLISLDPENTTPLFTENAPLNAWIIIEAVPLLGGINPHSHVLV
jgi:hypothetical protein